MDVMLAARGSHNQPPSELLDKGCTLRGRVSKETAAV